MVKIKALTGFVLGIAMAIIVIGVGIVPALAFAENSFLENANKKPVSQAINIEALDGFPPLVIPAAAFTSDGEDPDGFYFNFSGGYVNGIDSACLVAPVYLPDGVTISRFYASLYDNATGSIFVALRRVNTLNGTSNILAQVVSFSDSTANQTWETSAINYANISNPLYAYYLTTCLGSVDQRLYSARIYYTEPIYLPLISR